jgi:hypothetical protein
MNAPLNTSQAQALPPLLQDAGVPFDMFIQALTEQLDKAQASMTIKARVGKLPMTFAVKEVSLDLRAFVQLIDDEVYVRPSGPGEVGASSIKLGLTTITKPMIEENAMSFAAEDPKFSLREALGSSITDEDRQRLERIGVRSVGQLNALREAAGADVVARLARMPVNRLQQAMLAASAPRVSHTEAPTHVSGARVVVDTPLLRPGVRPRARVNGLEVAVVHAQDQTVILEPLAHQLGSMAELDFGDGQVAQVALSGGSFGRWLGAAEQEAL